MGTFEHDKHALTARLRAAGCVFAEEEADLLRAEAPTADALERMVERRESGDPLEYIVGWTAFAGKRIRIGPPVFVPRRRTQLLAREAARCAAEYPSPIVVDLCCGAGAIGAAVLFVVPNADVWACDVDAEAVRWARRNLPPDRVVQGDLFDPLPDRLRGRVDVLVANAPYVPTEAIEVMPPEARLYEARVALDGGRDGLDVHRRILDGASAWLPPGGCLLLETSERQAFADAHLFRAVGLEPRIVHDDDIDGTIVIGRAFAG